MPLLPGSLLLYVLHYIVARVLWRALNGSTGAVIVALGLLTLAGGMLVRELRARRRR